MKPLVLVDVALPPFIAETVTRLCDMRPWDDGGEAQGCDRAAVAGLYTYGHPRVDAGLLERLPALRVISNFGVGVDHIDLAAAAARGVPVGNTPGCLDGATADMTFALLLAAARNIVVGDRFARSAAFTHFDPSLLLGAEVHGSVLGIIGLGRIGRQVARRATGFDMRLLYHNRRRDLAAEEALGVRHATLEELLRESRFVTLNVPLNAETRGMIGERELRLMRRDGVLINVARGGVVDHAALYRALREGWIHAAAVDVTDPEPLPRDHPLLSLDNLVITPHLGSAADGTRRRMAEMASANLRAGLEGKPLPWAVAP